MKPDRQTIYLCAQASACAYRSDLSALFPGFDSVQRINDEATDTQGFIATNCHTVLVAFRGTESPRDWVTDAQCRLQDVGMYRAHQGFCRAAGSVEHEILWRVREHEWAGKKVIFTGHSLGGALAQIAALNLVESGLRVDAVVSFGSPRVGDGHFRAYYNTLLGECSTRVVNQTDMVTRLPGLLQGYRHGGLNEVFFDAFGYAEENPPLPTRLTFTA